METDAYDRIGLNEIHHVHVFVSCSPRMSTTDSKQTPVFKKVIMLKEIS